MGKTLKVVLAEDDALVLRTVRRYLENLGHDVVAEASTGEELIEAVLQHRPHIVVADIRLRGMDGLKATEVFTRSHQLPVIVLSGCDDQPTIERASVCPIHAYLAKPIREIDLATAIPIAMERFREMRTLHDEVEDARRRLVDRADVEKAKGVLMRRADVDETTAYQKLRSMARNTGQTMGHVARSLLLAEAAFLDLEPAPRKSSPSVVAD